MLDTCFMAEIEWIDAPGDPREPGLYEPPARFRVDGVDFKCATDQGHSTRDRFLIRKDHGLVQDYAEILRSFRGANVIELGIASGGSAALMSLLAAPKKLVAIDLTETRVEALDQFISDRSLDDCVKAHYGIDQADRECLIELIESEFDDGVDLVIDDASHRLEETRITFEALFPRLRPQGLYVIEDWNHDHLVGRSIADALNDPERSADVEREILDRLGDAPRPQPLSRLVLELVLAQAESEHVVTEVTVDHRNVCVRRGPAVLSPTEFSLRNESNDLGLLAGD